MEDRFRLKKRQSFTFMVGKPCKVVFSRLGHGMYQVAVVEPVPEVEIPVEPDVAPKGKKRP